MEKSITINVALKWPDVPDDYVARYPGHEIARIRLDHRRDPSGPHWEWMIVVPMALPAWSRGRAGSRDAGLKALAATWQRLLKETSPERIDRLWEFERAAPARQEHVAQPEGNSALQRRYP